MDKRLLYSPSEKLAADAVDELTCQNHMNSYTQCIMKNKVSNNYKECVPLMDEFRFCILLNAKKQQENQKKIK